MITYEPFKAMITGIMMSFKARDGLTYTLKKPGIRLVKGQRFMLKINSETQDCVMLPIIMPDHPGINR